MEALVVLVAIGVVLLLVIQWIARSASTNGGKNTHMLNLNEPPAEPELERRIETIASGVVRKEISRFNTDLARVIGVLDRLRDLADNRRRLARRSAYSIVGFPALVWIVEGIDALNEIRERFNLQSFDLLVLGTLLAVAGVAAAVHRWARDFDDILAGNGEEAKRDGKARSPENGKPADPNGTG